MNRGNSPSNQCTQEESRHTDPKPNTPPLLEYVRRDSTEQKKLNANVKHVRVTATLKPLLEANKISFVTATLTFKQQQHTDS